MFAPPAEITAEVFTRLPDSMRRDPNDSYWTRVQHRGHGCGCFLEGPSFDREGNLYTTDIAYGRVFKVTPDGTFHLVAEYDGEPNGLKIHKDGRAFIADLVLDPASGAVAPVVDRPYLERFYGCNDLILRR